MKTRLLWKLFGLNLLTIGFVVGIVWGAVDYLAGDYFTVLMEKYHISPTQSHAMFVDSIHRYLIWGSLCAILLSSLISYFIMRRILDPLTQMTRITRRIATGDFSAQVPVTTRDEVGQLAGAFNRMSESLNHMEQLRKTMIVDAAHELKTPLTNIQGYTEALMDEMVPRSPETFSLLQEETRRLARFVSDMLQLARAGGAKFTLDILEIRLSETIRSVYKVFRNSLSEKEISVIFNPADTGFRVFADPDKLTQILNNLFQNVLQYTPAGGTMRIFAEKEKEAVKITFANTRGDAREEDIPLIFERFYRGEKSRSREYGGAGIGLAIVRELVEAHKGLTGAYIQNDEFHIWFTLPDHFPD